MLKIIPLFFLILITGLAAAKGPASVSGSVKLPDGNPAEMTNVILLQASDSSMVKGSVSDANGAGWLSFSHAATRAPTRSLRNLAPDHRQDRARGDPVAPNS